MELSFLALVALCWSLSGWLYLVSRTRITTKIYDKIYTKARLQLRPTIEVHLKPLFPPQKKPPSPPQKFPIEREMQVKCPEKMFLGETKPLEVTFPAKRVRITKIGEAGVLKFKADEKEPEVGVRLLAADFDIRPAGVEQNVRIIEGQDVSTIFNIAPRSSGLKNIDILTFYNERRVGRVTRKITVVDYVADRITKPKAELISISSTILGIIVIIIELFPKLLS